MSFHPFCNICAASIDETSYFMSCGHFYCISCAGQQTLMSSTGNLTICCRVCGQDSEAVVISEGGYNLPVHVREYVLGDPVKMISKGGNIAKFQLSHYASVIDILRKSLHESQRCESEAHAQIRQYKADLDKVTNRVRELEAQVQQLSPRPTMENKLSSPLKSRIHRNSNAEFPLTTRRNEVKRPSPLNVSPLRRSADSSDNSSILNRSSKDVSTPISRSIVGNLRVDLYGPQFPTTASPSNTEQKRTPTPIPSYNSTSHNVQRPHVTQRLPLRSFSPLIKKSALSSTLLSQKTSQPSLSRRVVPEPDKLLSPMKRTSAMRDQNMHPR